MKTLVGVFDHSCVEKVMTDLQGKSINNITIIDGRDLPKPTGTTVVGPPEGISGNLAMGAPNSMGLPYMAPTNSRPSAPPSENRLITYLKNKGVPADEVNYYASILKEQAVLLVVKVLDNQAPAVKAIFDRYQQSAAARL